MIFLYLLWVFIFFVVFYIFRESFYLCLELSLFVVIFFYICREFFIFVASSFNICCELFLYLLWVFIFVVSFFFYLQREVHSPEHKFILDLVGIFLSWNLYCQARRKYWTVLIKILWSNSWSAQPHYKLHWIVWFDSPRKGGRGNGND